MIVIPMAGLSRRFTEAGYDRPKYMLDLGGRSVFACAVGSFGHYFRTHPFLIVLRDVAGTVDFVRTECAALGIADWRLAVLNAPTSGQAETVALGIDQAEVPSDTALTIFNIDTFRPGFTFPDAPWFAGSAGYLEVFRGSGANWSYVRPTATVEPIAAETAEKRPISDLCCTGLYHFAAARDFRQALARERENPTAGELYVAPLYNHLIAAGRTVHYVEIDPTSVIFCGVPAEYEVLAKQPPLLSR